MKAIVLERNPLVRRKLERYFRCAGFEPCATDEPGEVERHLTDCQLIGADIFDGEAVARAVAASPGIQTVFWTAEPMDRALRLLCEHENFNHVLGRPDFDSAPRGWELMLVLRRLLRPSEEGPKFAWYLDWGFTGFQERVDSSATRDKLVHKVERFVNHLGARRKIAEQFAEVAHELLMNAMYDAPVDPSGNPRYARDRKAEIHLPESERPKLKLASDGSRLAIQVTDPFGGLRRSHVVQGIARGLQGGQMDTSHGGAGLGLTVIHNGTAALFFDVVEGARTEVTGVFDLDTSHRDFRLMPKSLHFFRR